MLYSFDHQQTANIPQLAPGELTDEQLLAAICARDESALATLKRRHEALIRSIVGRMINNDCDVDDLVQEIMLAVWDHADGYDAEKGKALGWLITLARRRTIDRIRRKSAYTRARERYREEACVHCDPHTGADEEAARDDTAGAVASLIEHLPPAQREVIQLTFYRGLSQRQIAAETGIPLGTIKTRIELALRKLRSAAFAFGEFRDRTAPAHAHS
jgi:RNA polymerase sigma-70 factor (ECF subfamily)